MIEIAISGVLALVIGGVMCSCFSLAAWKHDPLPFVIGAFLVLVGLVLLGGNGLLFFFMHGLLERF